MTRIEILSHQQNLHIVSDLWSMGERAKWQLLEHKAIVKPNQYCIPESIAETNGTIKDLKDVGVMIFTISSFNSDLL